MSVPLEPHPLYEPWRHLLGLHPELFQPFRGYGFRFGSPDYLRAEQLLSGAGSARVGGRYNAPGSFPAVYTSTTDLTAAHERGARARFYGAPEELLQPAVLMAVSFDLGAVLDLGDEEVCTTLGVAREDLRGGGVRHWRTEQADGREALTQALGRAAFAAGAEGLLIPSAEVADGVNLVFFPTNRREGSRVTVVQGERITRLAGPPPPVP